MSTMASKGDDDKGLVVEAPLQPEEDTNISDDSQLSESVSHENIETESSRSVKQISSTQEQDSLSIRLNAEFNSFIMLRDAIEKYQREKAVQLIVKDSKLLKAESTRKVIPKVYHLVNQDLMYHSITYVCKCHGELRQKPGTRVKNVGQKRLNCPMYIRFKLSPDLQTLVLFDLHEKHNHDSDPTTFTMTPRQQVYHLSRVKRKMEDEIQEEALSNIGTVDNLPQAPESEPAKKSAKIDVPVSEEQSSAREPDNQDDEDSSLDSDSSCSDTDEEELRNNRQYLPFPVRLIGSAVRSNPELLSATKELIELQKSKVKLEKQKLLTETRLLELTNTKLELEVKQLQRTLASQTSQSQDTTIFLQT